MVPKRCNINPLVSSIFAAQNFRLVMLSESFGTRFTSVSSVHPFCMVSV